jgi:ATP-dependent Clp protease ATP-binding subunit ClpA
MFERFTNQARRVVVLAQEESRNLNHNYIGTEHLVLGILHEARGTGARALESTDVTLEAVRREVEARIGRGSEQPAGHIPFTPRAKKALELSLRESLALGQNYIGTGHLLLGLIRKGDAVGVEILVALGADLNVLRARVIELLPDDTEEEAPAGPPTRIAPARAERPPGVILGVLDSIDARLTMIERHLGITRSAPDELLRYDRRIAKVVGAKEEAIERQDFERAAALREEEKHLRSERARVKVELEEAAVREVAEAASDTEPEPEPEPEPAEEDGLGEVQAAGAAGEVARLQAEVARLMALLREHDIDLGEPQDPPAAAG